MVTHVVATWAPGSLAEGKWLGNNCFHSCSCNLHLKSFGRGVQNSTSCWVWFVGRWCSSQLGQNRKLWDSVNEPSWDPQTSSSLDLCLQNFLVQVHLGWHHDCHELELWSSLPWSFSCQETRWKQVLLCFRRLQKIKKCFQTNWLQSYFGWNKSWLEVVSGSPAVSSSQHENWLLLEVSCKPCQHSR